MEDFEYSPNPGRVIFGNSTINRIPDELKRLNFSKPVILSTPEQLSQAQKIESILQGHVEVIGIFSNAMMHTPVHVTNTAVEFSRAADCIVSIGGGSTIGLGKAISIRTGLYHIAIATTYAGSEMTPILGETENGQKTTRSDPKILPGTVIYDVDLTMTLPVQLTSVSAVNAIAHALMAAEGIKVLASFVPEIVANPDSRSARSSTLYGAWLCGICLGSVGMSLHHKLCHTLGGSFNLPHAQMHTIVLPHALAYNAPKVPRAMETLAKALPNSDGDAVKGLNVLLGKLKVQRGLRELGMKESDVDVAADIALKNAYWNPREIERDPIRELIRRAWAGEDARSDL
ncbi:putative maleylacetate reductase [Xylaria arbuscula]|nr:putative maleylacetate reductase [Xylaria arbuscula]